MINMFDLTQLPKAPTGAQNEPINAVENLEVINQQVLLVVQNTKTGKRYFMKPGAALELHEHMLAEARYGQLCTLTDIVHIAEGAGRARVRAFEAKLLSAAAVAAGNLLAGKETVGQVVKQAEDAVGAALASGTSGAASLKTAVESALKGIDTGAAAKSILSAIIPILLG